MEVIETWQGDVVREPKTREFIHQNFGGGAGIKFVLFDCC
jgi:hypothetical protein